MERTECPTSARKTITDNGEQVSSSNNASPSEHKVHHTLDTPKN